MNWRLINKRYHIFLREGFLVSLAACLMVQVVKTPPAMQENTGDMGLIPGLGRTPGEANGNPLQYSYPGNPTDRGDGWATVHGVAKSPTQLSTHMYVCTNFFYL